MSVASYLKSFFENLDQKQFQQYMLIVFVMLLLVASFVIFQFYSATNALRIKMNNINEQREQVRDILNKAHLLLQKKNEIKELFEEDKSFKIAQAFKEIIEQVGLSNKIQSDLVPTQEDKPGDYGEIILAGQLSDIDMKQITDLLAAIAKKKRIYIKNIDMVRAKKGQNSIDMSITIATLYPKNEQAEAVE